MGIPFSTRFWYLQFTFSGLLLGGGFLYPDLWWVGLLGITSFVSLVVTAPSLRLSALGGGIAWSIKSLLATYWFFSTEPFSWLPAGYLEPSTFTIGFFWLYVGVLLGLGGAVVAAVTKIIACHQGRIVLLLSLPFLWVLGELLSSLLFSLGTHGPGGSLGLAFSFGYSGYLLVEHQTLMLLGTWGGVYVLSAAAALLGSGLWYLGTRESLSKRAAIILGALLLLTLTSDLSPQQVKVSETKSPLVAVVETGFTSEMMRDSEWAKYRTERFDEAVRAALTHDPDYILLPEDARFVSVSGGVNTTYDYFRLFYGDPKTVVIDSQSVRLGNGDTVLRAYVLDGIAKTGWSVDKKNLVPAGEYVPYVTSLITQIFDPTLAESLKQSLVYRPGPEVDQRYFADYLPGILFCFASADPLAVWRLTKEREVPFVAHPISHALFSKTTQLEQQLDNMLKLQALFNQTPIVSAGNLTPSALYLPDGTQSRPTMVASGEGWQVGLFQW